MKKFGWTMILAVACCLAASLAASAADEKAGGEARRAPGKRPDAGERFKAMDSDGNGSISLAEWKAAHEKRIAAMKERMGDKFDAARVPNPEDAFKKLDKDNDGKLTKEEVAAGRPAGDRRGPGGRGGGDKPAGGEGAAK